MMGTHVPDHVRSLDDGEFIVLRVPASPCPPITASPCPRVPASPSMDSLFIAAPVAFAQFLFQDFAGTAFGQRVEKLDRLGDFEPRQFGAAKPNQLLLANRLSGL